MQYVHVLKKKNPTDPIPRVEGGGGSRGSAGNIFAKMLVQS